jgi:hypothetical protein
MVKLEITKVLKKNQKKSNHMKWYFIHTMFRGRFRALENPEAQGFELFCQHVKFKKIARKNHASD